MRDNLARKVLMGLLLTGGIAIAATSPYFLINIARAYSRNKRYQNSDKRKIAQALSYLKNNQLIILKEENDRVTAELTEKGKRKIKQFQFNELQIVRPEKWDGKWRIAIFDIPEKLRKGRDALRNKLNNLGFYELQKSVWAHPYPCENEIQLVAEMFKATPFINIILADKISNDVKLKSYFHLL